MINPKLKTLIDTADSIQVAHYYTSGNVSSFEIVKYNWPPEHFEGTDHILRNYAFNFALTKNDLTKFYEADDCFERAHVNGSIYRIRFFRHINMLRPKTLDQITAIDVS